MNRKVQDKDIIVKWCLRIAILIAIVGFFIPYCCVSCSGQSQNISAMEFAVGAELFGEKIDPYPIVWSLLIAPLLLIAVLAGYQKIKETTRKILEICASIIHFISNSYIKNLLTDECNSSGGTLELKAGYTFMIVFVVLSFGIVVLDCFLKEDKVPSDNRFEAFPKPPDIRQSGSPLNLQSSSPPEVSTSTGPKKASLVGVSGQYKGFVFDLSDGSTIVLGRSADVCHIVFDTSERMISHKHCSIRYNREMDRFIIEVFSKNKVTFGDGTKIGASESKTIGRGETFFLATEKNTFKVL